jgi:S-(hydroxymethyl)glutathione dehydrogenase/alcohol dehydrogenase
MEKKLCGCLLGSCNSTYDIPRMMRAFQNGQLDLHSMVGKMRPFEEINEAFDDLHHGREIRTVMKIGS